MVLSFISIIVVSFAKSKELFDKQTYEYWRSWNYCQFITSIQVINS